MPQLKTKAAILAKIESGGYGVDPTPVAGTNAILCEPPEFSVVGRRLERNNVQAWMGKHPPLNIGDGLRIRVVTELKGSGIVATPPEIGPLFRACNFTQTITPATKVDYDPNSAVGTDDSSEAITIYYHQDKMLHHMHGCRGTLSVNAQAGEKDKITWEFTGLYGGPVASTTPEGTFSSAAPLLGIYSFTIDTFAAVIEAFDLDVANTVTARKGPVSDVSGVKEWLITNRDPKFTINPEVPEHATKSFWTMWETTDEVALAAQLGSVAGNKIIITAPAAVLNVPSYAERETMLTHGLSGSLHPDSGNDEIKFSFQ